MKTTFKIILCCLPIFWIIISCSKDDLELLVVNDFTATIDENPNQDQLIGTIPYEVNRGTTLFIITSENVPNAIYISNLQGYHASIYVNDPTFFDFETHPIITVKVKVERGTYSWPDLATWEVFDSKTITITINLNDLPE